MHTRSRGRWFILIYGFALCFLLLPVQAQPVLPDFRPDRILIKPRTESVLPALNLFHTRQNRKVLQTFNQLGHLQIISVPAGKTATELITEYQRSGLVEFAEPDYIIHAAAIPNDPQFTNGTLWALNNIGQNGGVAGADIDATNGWDVITSASNIVVAIADSGIRYTHEDLAANMWTNPDDGGHGYNAFTGTNDCSDDNGHGTLIAGVLGAVGNNGKGVTGVAWSVQMMACKCLDNLGNGSDSTLIACIDYARTHGARIINASLDSAGYSAAVSNAIVAARDAGILFIASAGNNSGDVDATPRYPACYNIDNIVSVAYTTRTDDLGFLSNYGATNVDLAAPGDQIYSTFPATDSYYYPPSGLGINLAGTSFAAAYVSGAGALLMAQYPSDNCQEIIHRLLDSTDPLPSLAGKCQTGGRLDLRKALRTIRIAALPTESNQPFRLHVDGGLNRTCIVETSTNLITWLPIFTNTTLADGAFTFTNTVTHPAQEFFRVAAAP